MIILFLGDTDGRVIEIKDGQTPDDNRATLAMIVGWQEGYTVFVGSNPNGQRFNTERSARSLVNIRLAIGKNGKRETAGKTRRMGLYHVDDSTGEISL